MMKHLIFLSLLLFSVLLPASEKSVWHPVLVRYSDGTEEKGELQLMGSRPLIVNTSPEKRAAHRKFHLQDLCSVTQETEKASMERPWAYRENGKIDRIYFEGTYPFLNFRTHVLTVTGERVTGHMISNVFRFRSGGKLKKLFLSRQIKGSVGQKMDDLRYPVRISFPENRPVGAVKLTLEISGFGQVREASALDRTRRIVTAGNVMPDGTIAFSGLLPGKQDLYVLTDSFILCGFPGTEEIPGVLEKNFRLADDFFPCRKILARSGDTVLVFKRRSRFHAAQRHVKGGFVWHLEQWNWHRAGEEWKLDSRNMLLRILQKGGEAEKRCLLLPALSDAKGHVRIRRGTPSSELTLPQETTQR